MVLQNWGISAQAFTAPKSPPDALSHYRVSLLPALCCLCKVVYTYLDFSWCFPFLWSSLLAVLLVHFPVDCVRPTVCFFGSFVCFWPRSCHYYSPVTVSLFWSSPLSSLCVQVFEAFSSIVRDGCFSELVFYLDACVTVPCRTSKIMGIVDYRFQFSHDARCTMYIWCMKPRGIPPFFCCWWATHLTTQWTRMTGDTCLSYTSMPNNGAHRSQRTETSIFFKFIDLIIGSWGTALKHTISWLQYVSKLILLFHLGWQPTTQP